MILTGKCKVDFEEWMLVNNKEVLKFSEERYSEVIDMSQLFKYLTDSMQYGVLVDFFDSVREKNTRQKSRTKEIEKENKRYNYEKTKE
tara:strand:+ start:295 stop:558 length:264 start_codon:yes stop_codon:yes gene_type:complete